MKGMPVSRLMLLVFVFVSVVLMLGPVRAEAAKKISGSVGKGGKTKVTGIFPEIGEINLTMLNWGFAADDPAAARAGVVLEEIEEHLRLRAARSKMKVRNEKRPEFAFRSRRLHG